jgi:hypothetical protein
MKSRTQKRIEAADRLDRYADRIERGEVARFTDSHSDRAAEAGARRAEAKRLRALS